MSGLLNTSTQGVINAGSFAANVDFTTGTSPQNIAMGALDGDSKPDIVTTNVNGPGISVFRNTSTLGTIDASSLAAKKDFTTGKRSQNGQQFTKIGTVQATGFNASSTNYKFFDPTPFKGNNFYRIKVIEAGHDIFTRIVKISIQPKGINEITIYPNPVKGNSIGLLFDLPKEITS